MTLLRTCCWAAGLALAAAEVPSLDPATYREPSDAEYWGGNKDARRPFAVERIEASQLDEAAFKRRILDGKVFVVEGVGKDWPMAKWDCDFFRSDPDFSKAEIQEMYTDNSGDVGFMSGWEEKKEPSNAQDPDAPQVAPYYWGIKNVEDDERSRTGSKAMLKKVRKHIKLPAFMPKANLREFGNTPEFWFAAAGGGAQAHMDSHIESTISFQIAGTKRWRLSFMDKRSALLLARNYFDGMVYDRKERWQPQFVVTLRPGEALFLPPGFVHETLNLAETSNCTASVTHQFDVPLAARMYRRFMPRVRRTGDIHEAWLLLKAWATLYGRAPDEGKEYAAAKAEAMGSDGVGANFAQLDADGDGKITEAELKVKLSTADGDGKITGAKEEFGDVDGLWADPVANLLGFQDLNEDGAIAREEFAEVYGLWAGITAAAIGDMPKKYKKLHSKAANALPTGFSLEQLPEDLAEKLLKWGRGLEAKRAVRSTEL